MAIVQHPVAFDLSTFRLGDFALGVVSATATSVTYTLGNRVVTLSGSFTLSGGLPVGGTIAGLTYATGATTRFAVTGLALGWVGFETAMGNDDFPSVLSLADVVTGSAANDVLRGYDGDDALSGGGGLDSLFGGSGADTMTGGGAADLLQGGSGDDVYRIDAADTIVEFASGGVDRVETAIATYTLGAALEDLTYTGSASFTGTGNAANNRISGGAGNDQLSGLGGDDTLRGGNGHDTLNGGDGNDSLSGDAGGATVVTSASRPSPSDPAQPLTLSMALPEVSPTTTTTVSGYVNNAALGQGTFNLAFVLDISGSMGAGFSGSTVGDVNGDGSADTRLDAAIAAFEALVASIEAAGLGNAVRIALIPFDSASTVAAIGNTTSDVNGNGVADLIEAARNLDLGGSTYYDLGLGNAVNFFNGGPTGNNHVFFLSDGEPNGGPYEDELALLRDPAGINASIRALGFGAGGSGTYYNILDLLDDGLANTSAINVTDPASLTAGLVNSQVDPADVAGLQIWRNGTLLVTLTPDQLVDTPFGLQYSYTIPGLNAAGLNQIETRLILSNGSGYISTMQTVSVGALVSNDRLVGGDGDDTLDGGAGNDTLIGGAGNDVYMVDQAAESITEAAGQGIDRIESTVTLTLQRATLANIENLTLLGSIDIDGTGNALGNRLQGNIGNNILAGLEGNDTLIGGFGLDFASYDRDPTAINANLGTGQAIRGTEVDILTEIEGLIGSDFNDTLTGSDGDNVFIGGAGNDSITGGNGVDTLDFSRATAALTASLNMNYGGGTTSTANGAEGTDTVHTIETIIGTRYGDLMQDGGYYTSLSNLFYGGIGNDELRGGDGNDTLYGGTGNDTLDGGTDASVSNTDVDLLDYSGETAAVRGSLAGLVVGTSIGRDQVLNFERVIATGFADSLIGAALNESIDGGAGNDTLRGGAGNDTLNGGAGVDSMAGDAGNDVFHVDDAGDVVSDVAAGGIDLVLSTVTYTLADNDVENLTLLGTADLNGTGNGAANLVTGNAGINRLNGGAGNDTLLAGDGNDTVLGGEGADSLNGGNQSDTLSYANSASGVTGTLNSTGTAIFVTASGNDTITAFEDLIGSGFNDVLGGDYYDNALYGGNGHDSITGGSGLDTLFGGAGNDTFDGGSGVDLLDYSGLAAGVLDADLSSGLVTGEGTDSIVGTTVEHLIGTDRGDVIAWKNGATTSYVDFTLDGGAGNDSLQGSVGDDTLMGGTGNDTMVGGLGYDLYQVDRAGDVVIEDQLYGGYDEVQSAIDYTLGANIEYLTLTGTANNGTGNALSNRIIGNERANVLTGGDGSDTLTGGLGRDSLYGGVGYDRFVFADVAESTGATADVIYGYNTTEDYLYLSDIDADTVAAGNQSFTFIGTAAFGSVAGQLRYQQTGTETLLLGDVNGDGVADLRVRLDGTHTLDTGDLYL